MINLTAKFLSLVEKENASLRVLQTQSAQNFRASKNAYLSDYARLSVLLQKEWQSHPIDAEKWNRLCHLNRLFSEVVHENYRLFASLEQRSRHLLEAIHQELVLLETQAMSAHKPSKRFQRAMANAH
ncbi:MAG: hypothetical protein LBQ26_00015 [Holosporales bacterium]|jgi:hypothetical protein|nr:hypothetical protein [Holosporales bacterium]